MTLKMRVMTTLWRVQQAQMVIAIVFWSLTLTGIFYPYLRERFLDDALGSDRVGFGMLLMFLVVVFVIVGFGLVYDKLKFWREQAVVVQERNPYTYGSKVWPQQVILMWALLNPEDPVAQKTAKALVAHSLLDPEVYEAVKAIEAEVGA